MSSYSSKSEKAKESVARTWSPVYGDWTVIMICKPNKNTDIVDSLQITIIQLENSKPTPFNFNIYYHLKLMFSLQLHGTLTLPSPQ